MTSKIFLAAALLCSLSACGTTGSTGSTGIAPADPSGQAATTAGARPAGWNLGWADEFDTDGLPNPANWSYDTAFNKQGWHNEERQYYAAGRQENSRVENGRLIIEARKEQLSSAADWGGQAYSSARLITRGKHEWTYGFLETRAKLPCGRGTWPAIWMLGTKGNWPMLGEIDIMEHVGRKKGEVLGTVHTGAFNHRINTHKGATIQIDDVCDAFHNYQLTWTPEQIAIGVDDKVFFTFANSRDGDKAKWPFGDPQYLILNVAVGGQLGGPVDDSIFPVRMEVEYVRMYQPQ